VEEMRLRFDFNHHKPLSIEELFQIEDLVNALVREDKPVKTTELSYEEAQKRPDIKQFFGEKYGKSVRVVDIEESKELCGGTHASRTGAIGYFRILKESSVAAGVRRIEAACGMGAETYARKQEQLLNEAASVLKTPPSKLVERAFFILGELEEEKKKMRALRLSGLKQLAQDLLLDIAPKEGVPFLGHIVHLEADELSLLADEIMQRAKSLVLVLGLALEQRCQIVIRVTPDLVSQGVRADALIKKISAVIGGGGGGKPESASAGGKKPEGLQQAIETVSRALGR
jgi:alanyl-tRNA synthetase